MDTEQLKEGDIVFDSELKEKKIVSIKEVHEEVQTYNFVVKDNNDYFANDILVHNKLCAYLFSDEVADENFEFVTLGVYKEKGDIYSKFVLDRLFKENEGETYIQLQKETNSFKLVIPPHEVDYINKLNLEVIDTLNYNSLSLKEKILAVLGILKEKKSYNLKLVDATEGFEEMLKDDDKYYVLDVENKYPFVLSVRFEELPDKDDIYSRKILWAEKGYYEFFKGSSIWYDFWPLNQSRWRNWLDTNNGYSNVQEMLDKLVKNHLDNNYSHSEMFEEKMADALRKAGHTMFEDYVSLTVTTSITSNAAPTTPTPDLVSVDGTNTTNADLNCSDILVDADGDKMNVTVNWYNNSDLDFSVNYNNNYVNNTLFNASLDEGNLTAGDSWICGIRLNDGTVNSAWGNSSSLTIIALDTIKPNINITYPLNNTNFSTLILGVNYTASDGTALFNCWYTNNSGKANNTLATCGTNITPRTWLQGINNVTVYANDTSGNINSSSVTFTIDTIKPNINITYPLNNTITPNNTLDVNYTVFDNLALSACWYSNDTYLVNNTLATCGTNITTIIWSAGLHNVTIWVNDSVNNQNSSSVRLIINTAPIATSVTLNSSNNLTTGIFTTSASFSDADGNSLIYEYKWYKDNTEQTTLVNYTSISSGLSAGTWYFKVRGNDRYEWGNWFNSTEVTLTAPTTTTTDTPTGGSSGGGSSPSFAVKQLSGLGISPGSFNLGGSVGLVSRNKISLSNNKNTPMEIKVSVLFLEKTISFKEQTFVLAPGENKLLDFSILPFEKPGVYTGKVQFIYEGKISEVPISLSIQSERALFDVSVDLSKEDQLVLSNEAIIPQINLIQAGLQEKMDVTINYLIKDFAGITYSQISETLMVQEQKTFAKEIKIGRAHV